MLLPVHLLYMHTASMTHISWMWFDQTTAAEAEVRHISNASETVQWIKIACKSTWNRNFQNQFSSRQVLLVLHSSEGEGRGDSCWTRAAVCALRDHDVTHRMTSCMCVMWLTLVTAVRAVGWAIVVKDGTIHGAVVCLAVHSALVLIHKHASDGLLGTVVQVAYMDSRTVSLYTAALIHQDVQWCWFTASQGIVVRVA